jgi:putative oxidoreductase
MMPKPPLARYADWTLLLLRVSVGATFIGHGMMKWGMLNAPAGDAMSLIMKILAIVEPITGVMVICGVAVEVAAVALVVAMAGAVASKFSAGGGFIGKNAWEFEMLLLLCNLVLLSTGPGRFSLDAVLTREERHWWQFWKKS